MEVRNLRWRSGPKAAPLAADRLPLRCSGQELTLARQKQRFPELIASIEAEKRPD